MTDQVIGQNLDIIGHLAKVLDERKQADSSTSYVASLLAAGDDKILKKIAEESGEVLLAGKDDDNEHLVYEIADLWFHTLVLLSSRGLSGQDVLAELARREGVSGLVEKASRSK